MERGIQYLRELAMREMVYYDPDNVQLPTDPDEVQCTRPMWQRFVQSTPPAYVKSLAVLAWKDKEAPTVDEVAGQLQQYKDSLSSSLQARVSAMERLSKKSTKLFQKLSREVRQLKEDMSYSPPVQTSISAIRTRIFEAACMLHDFREVTAAFSCRLLLAQGFVPWYSTKQIPQEAKVCSPEVQGSELAECPPRCPEDPELHHFVVTAAKAALELDIPYQALLIGENKVQHGTSPRGLLYHLEEKVIINTFQEPPALLVPCCVLPPADVGVVEVHHKDQTRACEREAAPICL
ncbi:hypothetical protein GRJ2_003476500 [Grus japonensis]|uniref:Uncharacterized protein n=1 Tax=Grus japonensis TaxID=30415 RepID=A0ABC9YKD9_GRUJA